MDYSAYFRGHSGSPTYLCSGYPLWGTEFRKKVKITRRIPSGSQTLDTPDGQCTFKYVGYKCM